MIRRTLVLSILVGAAVPGAAWAQAWTHPAGHGYLNLSLSTLSASSVYSPDFSRQPLGRAYSQTIVGLYGELGLVDRWLTATVNAELFRRNSLADDAATQGFGDLRLGLWTGLLTAPLRLTLGVEVGLPTGDPDPTAQDPALALSAASLPTGDGEFDVEPKLLLGYSLQTSSWPLRHFVVAGAGYWIRGSPRGQSQRFADAFTYRLELGTQLPWSFLERVWVIARLGGVESFASNERAAEGVVGLGDGVTFTSLGVQVAVDLVAGLGLTAGFETAVRARSIAAAAPLRFGLSYRF